MEMEPRWAFLGAWLAPLRGLLALQPPRVTRRTRFSLVARVSASKTDRQGLREAKSALLLLLLLAKGDHTAFKRALQLCHVPGTELWAMDDRAHPFQHRVALTLGVGAAEALSWDQETLDELFGGPDAASAGKLAAAVQEIAAKTTQDVLSHQVAVAVQVQLSQEQSHEPDPSLRSLIELREKHYGWSISIPLGAGSSKLTWAIDVVNVVVFADCSPEAAANCIDHFLVSGGSELTLVKINVCDVPQAIARESDTQPGGQSHILQAPRQNSGSNRLANDPNKFCPVFPRLNTGLSKTSTVSAVEVGVGDHYSTALDFWYWTFVVNAFFSNIAQRRSSVTHLRLSNVTNSDVFGRLLDEEDKFMQRDSRESDTWTRATIKAGTNIRLHPLFVHDELARKSISWTLKSDLPGVRVLSRRKQDCDDPDTTIVVVPGYGVCQLNPDSLTLVEDIGFRNPNYYQSTASSLDIEFTNIDLEDHGKPANSVSDLLSRTGSSLTTLRVFNLTSSALTVSTVFDTCKHLEALALAGIAISAVEFLRVYQKYEAVICDVSCEFDEVVPILNELADKSSPFAEHMRTIRCWSQGKGYAMHAERDMVCLRRMLKDNQTLTHIEFASIESAHTYAMSIIEPHRNQSFFMPLQYACRIAFLSIFSAVQASHPSRRVDSALSERPLPQPDCDVLSLIFEFAASVYSRQIICDAVSDFVEF